MMQAPSIPKPIDGAHDEASLEETPKASTTQRTVLPALYPWKLITSYFQKAAPYPPIVLFFGIIATYYILLSGYRRDFTNRGIAPDAETQLKKARSDFYFIVAMGVSFVFSALYFGADTFSGLWALIGAASASATRINQGQHGAAGSNIVLSERRKAAINAALALVGASVMVVAGWLQFLRRVAELQEGGA